MRYLLLVDDDAMTRSLVAEALTPYDYAVTSAASANAAHDVLKVVEFDVALIDLNLGRGPNGFDVAHKIKNDYPHTAILIYSNYASAPPGESVRTDLPEYATYLPKSKILEIEVLLSAIQSAIDGTERPHATWDDALAALTPTQRDVLHQLAQGYTTDQIAKRRHTTRSATEQMLTGIYRRLGISTESGLNARTEAVRQYIDKVGIPTRDE